MLLAAGSVSELLKVVQIVSWIVFPVLTIVIGCTVYFHYSKKKRNQAEALSASGMQPAPATLARLSKDADYVLFDHTGLFDEYHKKLCHLQAMYASLQHKFSALEVKCTAMAVFAIGKEKMYDGVSAYPSMKREVDQFVKKYNTEKRQMESSNMQLTHTCLTLQKENQLLRAQLSSALSAASLTITQSTPQPQTISA